LEDPLLAAAWHYCRTSWREYIGAFDLRTLVLTHFSMISAELTVIRSPTTASLLALSIVLLIAFPLWMQYRERSGKCALVPNSLWKSLPFTSVCALVALSRGAETALVTFSSL
jgi:hypothetical protein